MLPTVLWISLMGLAAALCMAGYRILRGPSVPDRIVGMDAASAVLINILIVAAILLDDQQYLTYAVVLSAISYVSTVSLGKYIQRGAVFAHRDSYLRLRPAGDNRRVAGEPGAHPDA